VGTAPSSEEAAGAALVRMSEADRQRQPDEQAECGRPGVGQREQDDDGTMTTAALVLSSGAPGRAAR